MSQISWGSVIEQLNYYDVVVLSFYQDNNDMEMLETELSKFAAEDLQKVGVYLPIKDSFVIDNANISDKQLSKMQMKLKKCK